jgi:hypothetical protein
MCSIVFRQIKLQSCPKISWYVLVPLIHNVDVSVPPEVQVGASATFVLKDYCFSTFRTRSGCFNTSDIITVISVLLEPHVDISVPLEPQVDVSVPLEQQMDVSPHSTTYH